jgi:hypothetical protein
MSMKLKMKSLNLLEACSIMGDALAFRMALVSNSEAMSRLMPLKDCLILLRVRLPWFRIMRAIFYILLINLSTKLGEFMLRNLILLGNQLMLNCLKRKLLLHQMIIIFNSTFDASYVLTNKSGKIVAKYVGRKHKGSKTCVWVPKVLVSNVKGPKTVWVRKNKA